jgi:hypothetical protein
LFLGAAVETGVLDGLAVGEGGELLQAQIDADLLARFREGTGIDLADDAGIPAVGPANEGASLRLSVERTILSPASAP